ncbi:hypothetical protein D3C73_1120970 [compost metagenome]
MYLVNLIRRILFKMAFYYQKFQFIVLSIFAVGIVDYFFIYEILVTLSPFIPTLFLEIGPIVLIIISIIIIKGITKYIQRKAKENKHLFIV